MYCTFKQVHIFYVSQSIIILIFILEINIKIIIDFYLKNNILMEKNMKYEIYLICRMREVVIQVVASEMSSYTTYQYQVDKHLELFFPHIEWNV